MRALPVLAYRYRVLAVQISDVITFKSSLCTYKVCVKTIITHFFTDKHRQFASARFSLPDEHLWRLSNQTGTWRCYCLSHLCYAAALRGLSYTGQPRMTDRTLRRGRVPLYLSWYRAHCTAAVTGWGVGKRSSSHSQFRRMSQLQLSV